MFGSRKLTLLVLIVTIVFCNGGLYFLITEFNDSIARTSITLFLPGLFLAYPALNLRFYPALFCNVVTGLLIDATSPVPFGSTAIIFLLIQLVINKYRSNIKKNNLYHGWVISQVTNLIIFSFVTLYFNAAHLFEIGIFVRTVFDFIISQLILALLTPWYLSLVKQMVSFTGVDMNSDDMMVSSGKV